MNMLRSVYAVDPQKLIARASLRQAGNTIGDHIAKHCKAYGRALKISQADLEWGFGMVCKIADTVPSDLEIGNSLSTSLSMSCRFSAGVTPAESCMTQSRASKNQSCCHSSISATMPVEAFNLDGEQSCQH